MKVIVGRRVQGQSTVLVVPRRGAGFPPVVLRAVTHGDIRGRVAGVIDAVSVIEHPEPAETPNQT